MNILTEARRVAKSMEAVHTQRRHGGPEIATEHETRADCLRLARVLNLPGLEYLALGEMLCGCGVCTGIADLERAS